VKILTL